MGLFAGAYGRSRWHVHAGTGILMLCAIAGIPLGDARARDGGSVEMLELKDPIFPPLLVGEGDVRIRLEVGRDGSVVSATATSGEPLLARAALESARSSKFACRDCESETTVYLMTYTFHAGEREGPGCCTQGGCPELFGKDALKNQKRHGQEVTWLGEHVTVVGPSFCICPDGCPIHPPKVRSWKCLCLWKCVVPKRFGIM